jgi:hypothetical protein
MAFGHPLTVRDVLRIRRLSDAPAPAHKGGRRPADQGGFIRPRPASPLARVPAPWWVTRAFHQGHLDAAMTSAPMPEQLKVSSGNLGRRLRAGVPATPRPWRPGCAVPVPGSRATGRYERGQFGGAVPMGPGMQDAEPCSAPLGLPEGVGSRLRVGVVLQSEQHNLRLVAWAVPSYDQVTAVLPLCRRPSDGGVRPEGPASSHDARRAPPPRGRSREGPWKHRTALGTKGRSVHTGEPTPVDRGGNGCPRSGGVRPLGRRPPRAAARRAPP